jgi:hypothetical protein
MRFNIASIVLASFWFFRIFSRASFWILEVRRLCKVLCYLLLNGLVVFLVFAVVHRVVRSLNLEVLFLCDQTYSYLCLIVEQAAVYLELIGGLLL